MAPNRTPQHVDVDVELRRFTAACRERGTPVTHQRLAVFRALLDSESHPDAEALHQGLRGTYPTLSLGTVYKTLETLQALGVAHVVSSPGPTRRFDGNPHPHHHLWCTCCQRLMDVELDDLGDIALPEGLGFEVEGLTIQFNGTCADCRSGEAPTHTSTTESARTSIHNPRKGAPR